MDKDADIAKLTAERDRYKQLAQGELRNQGAQRVFAAAAAAALHVVRDLMPDDEREAFESAIGKSMDDALAEGLQFQLGDQKLNVKA